MWPAYAALPSACVDGGSLPDKVLAYTGCGFVEFRKWAQAERAMEAHNGTTKLPVRPPLPAFHNCCPTRLSRYLLTHLLLGRGAARRRVVSECRGPICR